MSDEYVDESDPTRSMHTQAHGETAPPQLRSGDVLLGRFEIIQFLARGGMGEVYEAADRHLQGKHLALKTLRPEIASYPVMRQLFERETLLAREILHPNVCPTYDLFRVEQPGGPVMFLTMKLLRGESLALRLNRLGPMPLEVVLRIAVQMAAALDAAHRAGVIHRDFKPGNVMLEGADGPSPHVYITDFGLARAYEADGTLAPGGRLFGTMGYIAPELLQGRIAGPASDVYAFGVVLHEMITGRRPQNKPGQADCVRPSTLRAGLPRAWDRLVLGCLAYDPSRRFQSAGEALAVFDSPSTNASLTLRTKTSRRHIVATASAAVALAGAVVWFRWPQIDDLLHPLQQKRFVAIMAWPPAADSPTRGLLQGVLNGIGARLARAEAADKNLLIISAHDVGGQAAPKTLADAVSSLGANLVLGASLRRESTRYVLAMRVYDAAHGNQLRQRELAIATDQLNLLVERASTSAAELLGVPVDGALLRDKDELAKLSPAAFQMYQEAVDLSDQPNDAGLDQAIEKLQKVLAAEPRCALAYANLAISYCRKFERMRDRVFLGLADRNATLAVQYNPNSAKAVFAVALVDVYSGKTERAIDGIGKALQLDPGNPQIPFMKARVLRDLGRIDEAQAVYRDILRERPNFWPAYNEIGYLLSRQFQYQKAAEAFGEASAVAPKVALPLANQGTMYLLIHQQAKAEDAYRRSLDRAPNYVAYVNLGTILFQRADYRQALDYYGKASDLRPKYDVIWRNLADCYTMLGNTARALDCYAKAAENLDETLKTNPRPAGNWLYLAFYHAKLGQRVKAESDIQTAEQLGGANLQSQLAKVEALALLGRKEEALRLLLVCLDRGLSTVDVELALDLKELRADPRYRRRVAK